MQGEKKEEKSKEHTVRGIIKKEKIKLEEHVVRGSKKKTS